MALYASLLTLLEPLGAALAVEIRLNPRIRIFDDAIERIDFHMTVDNHPDTIAGPEDGVQIVRDHDNGEPQFLL
jgi:ABC-type uncharacterized transport system YnjBCD ATPase subunit